MIYRLSGAVSIVRESRYCPFLTTLDIIPVLVDNNNQKQTQNMNQ